MSNILNPPMREKGANALSNRLFPYIVLIVLSAIVFLPHVTRLGLYRDDWYYIADGYFGGPKIFHTMFWIDRPARGYLFELLFTFFGAKAIYYHLLMWVWRCSAGLFSFALFDAIWPGHKKRSLTIALLFTLYPGFLWWVSGVEYQPMLLSLSAHIASIWLTILYIRSDRLWQRALFLALSLLGGWLSLWLVDYAIGMELFRLVCIYFYFHSCLYGAQAREVWRHVLSSTFVGVLVLAGFLSWRLFFFSGARTDTDIAFQLGVFLQNPAETTGNWLINLARSLYSVMAAAWHTPLQGSFSGLAPMQKLAAVVLTLLFLLSLLAVAKIAKRRKEHGGEERFSGEWTKVALAGGVLGLFGSVLPIVLMNRVVTIQHFSHYALPASLCVALIVVAVLSLINLASVRGFAALLLIAIAVLSAHSHALSVVNEERTILEFWRQFSQRVPGLARGTTLLVYYPNISYGEENDIVWGPANLVYLSPQEVITTDGQIEYPLAAARMHPDAIQDILQGAKTDESYRSHALRLDFENLLVASQPSPESCVHVMDARWPRLDAQDAELIVLASTFSKISTVSLDAQPPILNPDIFGGMMEENWCTFYQEAELKVQAQDWARIPALLDEAQGRGFVPANPVEWLPFLQAAFVTGDRALITRIAEQRKTDSFFNQQACQLLVSMQPVGYSLDSDAVELAQQLFCGE